MTDSAHASSADTARQQLDALRQAFGERLEGRIEVEQRMFVLASLLRHDSYGLRPMGITEAEGKTRVIADMVGTRNGSVSVPFIAASSRGRWFVERILTDALTGR